MELPTQKFGLSGVFINLRRLLTDNFASGSLDERFVIAASPPQIEQSYDRLLRFESEPVPQKRILLEYSLVLELLRHMAAESGSSGTQETTIS